MLQIQLPPPAEMYAALAARDTSYDGVFVTAVRTTGIFCRPSCSAKTPLRKNVDFYASVREALAAGFRPCKRCRPLHPPGAAPEWLSGLLAEIERDPAARFSDADLRARSLEPARVRRWFQATHGLTFHAYQRARRLGLALGRIRHGADLQDAGLEHGFESQSGFRDAFERLFGETPGRSRNGRQERVCMTRLLSPLGPLVAAATSEGLCLLEFADRRMLETQVQRLQKRLGCVIAPGSNEHIERTALELEEYFEGSRQSFEVPLVVPGTEFQKEVWDQLARIPYGTTLSYERMAREIGRPGAQRAVGRANGDNRLAIILPCHRVVRSDGTLCGYGGGLWRKQALLEHEISHAN